MIFEIDFLKNIFFSRFSFLIRALNKQNMNQCLLHEIFLVKIDQQHLTLKHEQM